MSAWASWNYGPVARVATSKPREKTAKELAAQKKRDEEVAERLRKEEADRKAAEARSAELLQAHLDDEQRKSLEDKKVFAVIGSDGERYEIDCTKRQHNVFELDKDGRRVREFCIGQTGRTPNSDNHLSQKLLLEADAKEFKRIANKWDLMPTRRAAI